MGKAYVAAARGPRHAAVQLQTYAACEDPASGARRRGYAELWRLVERLSGAQDAEVRAFFATGMLLNVAAAMDLPDIAGDPKWALEHLRALAREAAA